MLASTYSCKPAFAHYAGSRKPGGVVFVAEAHGEDEARLQEPLVGYSGKEFFRMLFEAWTDAMPEVAAKCLNLMDGDAWVYARRQWLEEVNVGLTNVMAFQPPDNNMKTLCSSKKELGPGYTLPPLSTGAYIRPEYLAEVERLREEIITVQPNLVVALGNTATWALLRATKIGQLRGTVAESVLIPGLKVLASYHPQAINYMWQHRPIMVADLMKARHESRSPEIKRPSRLVIVEPSLDDVREWFARPAQYHAVDIETSRRQIEMIGFARSRDDVIVIPLVDWASPSRSYWPDESTERCVWDIMERDSLANPSVKKIFQNGLFDLQHILPTGLRVLNACEDTMLLHHSLYPELQKGLGFLGSVYCNEPAWKDMRVKGGETEENKRDE